MHTEALQRYWLWHAPRWAQPSFRSTRCHSSSPQSLKAIKRFSLNMAFEVKHRHSAAGGNNTPAWVLYFVFWSPSQAWFYTTVSSGKGQMTASKSFKLCVLLSRVRKRLFSSIHTNLYIRQWNNSGTFIQPHSSSPVFFFYFYYYYYFISATSRPSSLSAPFARSHFITCRNKTCGKSAPGFCCRKQNPCGSAGFSTADSAVLQYSSCGAAYVLPTVCLTDLQSMVSPQSSTYRLGTKVGGHFGSIDTFKQ